MVNSLEMLPVSIFEELDNLPLRAKRNRKTIGAGKQMGDKTSVTTIAKGIDSVSH